MAFVENMNIKIRIFQKIVSGNLKRTDDHRTIQQFYLVQSEQNSDRISS